jgi:hypothetical protein
MNKDSTIQEGIQGLGNCARCGWEFVCGMRAGMGTCWCIELPTLRDADPGAGDCYCPDCLKALIAERQHPT